MPLPFIVGAAAGLAGLVGIGSAVKGAGKMKKANSTMEEAGSRHQSNIGRFERDQKSATLKMDELGKEEMEILNSFKVFQDVLEKIHNRPEFKGYEKDGVSIPRYEKEKLTEVSIGAGVLLGGLGGAGLGTAGGFAAAGATTAAVMALGTASTGTTISTLGGVAATNATLAALGGGSIAVGGGGMALGSTILGGATLGVGFLVGGVVFNIVGSSLSNKADEAWLQMTKAEAKINSICSYLSMLRFHAGDYLRVLKQVNTLYQLHLNKLILSVKKHQVSSKTNENIKNLSPVNWNDFSKDEQLNIENTSLLVGMLYKMCKVQLVKKAKNENEINTINRSEINTSLKDASTLMSDPRFTH